MTAFFAFMFLFRGPIDPGTHPHVYVQVPRIEHTPTLPR